MYFSSDLTWEYESIRDSSITNSATKNENIQSSSDTPFDDVSYQTVTFPYNTYPVSYASSSDVIYDYYIVSNTFESGRITYFGWDFTDSASLSDYDTTVWKELVAASISFYGDDNANSSNSNTSLSPTENPTITLRGLLKTMKFLVKG